MATLEPGDELKRMAPADSEQIVSAIELELATSRAQRRSFDGTRTLVRALGLLFLLGLLAAGLGAMWYLQTFAMEQQGRHPSEHGVTPPAP